MTGRCTKRSVDARPFFIEGSTVRVRQRASRKSLQMAISLAWFANGCHARARAGIRAARTPFVRRGEIRLEQAGSSVCWPPSAREQVITGVFALAVGGTRTSADGAKWFAPPGLAISAHTLKLTFSDLALIYKSLQAPKTVAALPSQDELLNDTIQIFDQALNRAVSEPRGSHGREEVDLRASAEAPSPANTKAHRTWR